MKSYLVRLNRKSLSYVKAVGALADKLGFRCYLIGGCVRDLILQREIVDLDIAVDGDAVTVAKTFARQCQGKVVVYPSFSTATVILKDDRSVDFSMIRQELYSSAGALPTVSHGDLSQDLFRRDFTINAMAIAIDPEHFGGLIDLYGGIKDLHDGLIRVLHAKSFEDDPTRILRAVRFEQRFRFKIEAKTLKWLRHAIKTNALKTVKHQRLFEEFKKNLSEGSSGSNIVRLAKLSFFQATDWGCRTSDRQMVIIDRISQLLNWYHRQVSTRSSVDRWLIYWMALCDDLPLDKLGQLSRAVSMTRSDQDKVRSAVISAGEMKKPLFLDGSRLEMFKILQNKSLEEIVYLASKVHDDGALGRIKWFLTKGRYITLKINGEDLKRLGIPAGKIFKTVLQEVLYCVVSGICSGRSQQLAFARKLYQLNQP